MKVFIDGKAMCVQNDVKVIYEDVIFGMNDENQDEIGELHVALNCEGIVADLISECEDGDAEVIGTMSNTYGEMTEWCI